MSDTADLTAIPRFLKIFDMFETISRLNYRL